jgi:hypothetical protein
MRLISEASAQLSGVPAVKSARIGWLSVAGQGEGLVIAVDLDDPADAPAQDAAVDAIQRAVAMLDTGCPVDVAFPGGAEPDPVADTVTATTTPFYVRT